MISKEYSNKLGNGNLDQNTNISPDQFKQKLPELIVFDQICDDLESLSEEYELSSNKTHQRVENQSCISNETEKRKKQVRDKFDGYLKGQGRISIERGRDGKERAFKDGKDLNEMEFEEKDGRLINELDSIQCVQKINGQVEQFILAFNKNPQNAINDYISKAIIFNNNPDSIAQYLIKIEGLNKITLGEYFGQNNTNCLKVLRQYCKLLDFKGLQFDKALRSLLSKFRIPGEAQQIQRVIYEFTLAYYDVNHQTHTNVDELFPLAYSIIMLATDAHNPKQEKKMTMEEFIKNTKGACPSISSEYLSAIYDRITKEKLETEISYIETLYGRIRDLSLPNIGEALKFTKQLMKGELFLKICRNTTKLVQRKIYLSEDEQKIYWISDPPKTLEEPRFILIKDIVDLTLGLGSPVMIKNKVPQEFDSMCFTITTSYRTLDLKAKTNKDRAKWINYLRAILIQRRDFRRKQMEKEYDSHWNADKIQEIWNTDIFPNWDSHWDYKNKKPKQKGYIAKGLQAICCCLKPRHSENLEDGGIHSSGFKVKITVLESLWKYGLPPASRKTLWPLVIGNNLALTSYMVDDMKKRKKEVAELQKYQFDKQVVQMGETLLLIRPDLPAVRDLLLMCEVFWKVIPQSLNIHPLVGLANLIHLHHFLAFYRGDRTEIDLRIQLFQFLLQKNAKQVRYHFQGLKIETRMYLVCWFLSVFSNCFTNQFLYRIWDNFLLQGEVYLFKVGISIIKYYEIQLKMCTFHEGLQLLRFPKNMSSVLFFEILQNQIDVQNFYYEDYIEKRKHAIIKTKVQSIPLE